MRGPRLRQAPGRDLTPRRLPSGKWVGCRHLTPRVEFDPHLQSGTWVGPSLVGFNADKAERAHDPAVGYTPHYH